MICTVAELCEMDLGTHMMVMEEWNEETEFGWREAIVVLHGYYTRVVHEDSIGGLIVATYVTNGEGDLVSMRVYTATSKDEAHNPAPYSENWVKQEVHETHLTGTEMWWWKGKDDDRRAPGFTDPLPGFEGVRSTGGPESGPLGDDWEVKVTTKGHPHVQITNKNRDRH